MGLALGVRLGLIAASGPPEVFEYDAIARNLLAGQGYVLEHLGTTYLAFFSGVPYVLATAAVYVVAPGAPIAMLVVQALFSVLLCAVGWRIGRRIGGDAAALPAALLVGLHPGLVYYDTHKLHPLGFDALTLAAATLALLAMGASPSARTAAFAGVALGLAALERPTGLAVVPLVLVWLALRAEERRYRGRRAAAYVGATLLVLLPWVVRNQVALGAPLLSTTAAEAFWRGNAAHSLGSSYLPSGDTVLGTAPVALRGKLAGQDELGQSRLFWGTAVEDLRGRSLGFLIGVARKFVGFWTVLPVSGILYPPAWVYGYFAYYAAILALALVGCASLWAPEGPAGAVPGLLAVLAVLIGVSLAQSLFYVELRHRWAVEPLLLVLTAVGGTRLWSRARTRAVPEAAR